MKKITLCLMLILALIIVPGAIFAAENVTEVGSATELTNALTTSGTIILTDNIELDTALRIEKGINVVLNLNGKTLSGTQKIFDVKGAELTITGEGTIKETNPYYAPIYVSGDSASKTTINVGKNVTLEGWSGVMISSDAANAKGIEINVDGKINSLTDASGSTGSGIYINGGVKNKDIVDVNLSSTAVINSTGAGIYAAGYATWNINGSKITGVESGLGIKAGKFNITNATITGTGEDKTPTTGYNNGINPSGAAIQLESNDGYAGDIEISISGGNYESKQGMAIYEYLAKDPNQNIDTKETKVDSIKITSGNFKAAPNKEAILASDDFTTKNTEFISSGTFSSDVSQYLSSNIALEEDENGNWVAAKRTITVEGLENVVDAKEAKKILLDSFAKWEKENPTEAEMFANSNVTISVEVSELTDREVDGIPPEIWESFVEALNKKDASAKMIKKFVDVSIWVADENMGLIMTKLVKPITLKMTLPEKLPTLEDGYERKCYVVRERAIAWNSAESEIEYEALDAELSEDGKTLKVTSDEFSLFGIGYSDVEKAVTPPADDGKEDDGTPVTPPTTGNEGATGEGGTGTVEPEDKPVVEDEKSETPDVPKTGDNVVVYAVFAVVAMAGMAVTIKMKRK